MNVSIFMGSPRKEGNTMQLTIPFQKELERQGAQCTVTWLYDKDIRPCIACRCCQSNWSEAACSQKDDMESIFEQILKSDLIVLATPIYSWYCTPPLKALLDRAVYGLNKYYGDEKGPSLWAGKHVALITTCGYRPEQGADLWETGVKRYCKHSQMQYLGMLAERHMGYNTIFMDQEKEDRVVQFAKKIIREISLTAKCRKVGLP